MKRKSSVVTTVISLVAIIFTTFMIMKMGTSWHIWSSKESIDLADNYFITDMDKYIQTMKHGFIKTAAFNSLHETFKELTTHGNFPKDVLTDADDDGYADTSDSNGSSVAVKPRLRMESGPPPIPYWAHPGCKQTNARLPYLQIRNPRRVAGDSLSHLIVNADGRYDQYIEEVDSGVYSLYFVVHILMIKKGQVEVTASPGVTMERIGTTPQFITRDGMYEYKITDIDRTVASPSAPLKITYRGTNMTGDVDDIAKINYEALTIYDSGIVNAQNTLFTDNLNLYHSSLESTLLETETDGLTVEVNPLRGIYIPAGFAKGIVWSESAAGDGMTVTLKDMILNPDDNLAILKSSGLIEEEAKLRHYALNDAGEEVIQSIESQIKPKIKEELKKLDDYYSDSLVNPTCGGGPTCPPDGTLQYTSGTFISLIGTALNTVEAGLNVNSAFNPKDIDLELIGPLSIRMDCTGGTGDATNFNLPSGTSPDTCTGGDSVDTGYDAYLIYREYKESSCSKVECAYTPHYDGVGPHGCSPDTPLRCEQDFTVTCDMAYSHEYILKNIRILVKITDTKYTYYDKNTNKWKNPTMQFYIMLDKIEDTLCNNNAIACNSIKTTTYGDDCGLNSYSCGALF